MRVWTKQNTNILKNLNKDWRHVPDERFILSDMSEYKEIMLDLYRWLAKHSPNQVYRPMDSKYPVWVALSQGSLYLPEVGYSVIELEVPDEMITRINVRKWSSILNYSYISKDKDDELNHRKKLKDMGISDTKAYMSQFYPDLKDEIIKSWDELFNYENDSEKEHYYGIIWEIRAEWIVSIDKKLFEYEDLVADKEDKTDRNNLADKENLLDKDYLVVYTDLADIVVEKLLRYEVVYSKREYLKKKYEESFKIFDTAYSFLTNMMSKLIKRPEPASMPYFGFLNRKLVERYPDTKILKLRVPKNELVYFDMFDWNTILRLEYLGEDGEEFNKNLRERGIKNSSDVMLTHFYPMEKRQIEKSWENLLEHYINEEIETIKEVQVALWRIKAEWIIEIL